MQINSFSSYAGVGSNLSWTEMHRRILILAKKAAHLYARVQPAPLTLGSSHVWTKTGRESSSSFVTCQQQQERLLCLWSLRHGWHLFAVPRQSSPKCLVSISISAPAADNLGPQKKKPQVKRVLHLGQFVEDKASWGTWRVCSAMPCREIILDTIRCAFLFLYPASPISMLLVLLITGRNVIQQIFWQELTFTDITDDWKLRQSQSSPCYKLKSEIKSHRTQAECQLLQLGLNFSPEIIEQSPFLVHKIL